MIKSLIDKGVLQRLEAGRKHRRAVFRIRELAPELSDLREAGDVGQLPAGAGDNLPGPGQRPGNGQDPGNRDADRGAQIQPAPQRPANRDPATAARVPLRSAQQNREWQTRRTTSRQSSPGRWVRIALRAYLREFCILASYGHFGGTQKNRILRFRFSRKSKMVGCCGDW